MFQYYTDMNWLNTKHMYVAHNILFAYTIASMKEYTETTLN